MVSFQCRCAFDRIVRLGLVAVALMLATSAPAWFSTTLGNLGLLSLSRSLVLSAESEGAEYSHPDLVEAERVLRAASEIDASNRTAWRGLVFAAASLGRRAEAIALWESVGATASEFEQLGAQARRVKRYEDALAWYEHAAKLRGERLNVFPASFAGRLTVLESYASAEMWQPCSWCNNAAGFFGVHEGVLEMSFHHTAGVHDTLGIWTTPDTSLSGFRELLLRVKGSPGTRLTLDVSVDGRYSRPISYQTTPSDWAVWTVPIRGSRLDALLVSIGDLASSSASAGDYRLFIDWIALR